MSTGVETPMIEPSGTDLPAKSTAAIVEEAKGLPISRELIGAQTHVGWPLGLPARRPGTVHVLLPFPGTPKRRDDRETPLYAPLATITYDWRLGRPIAYENLWETWPWPPIRDAVGRFPHEAIRPLRERDGGRPYYDLRAELLSLYDDVFNWGARLAPLPAEREQRFRVLWRRLMEPSLEPYYRHLAPSFTRRFLPAP
jgi:hypothetical protein